jgi:hypothetical protein
VAKEKGQEMSDYTSAYFDYKTTTRVVLGVVVAFGMALGTCAYSWQTNLDDKKVDAAKEAAFRKDMFDHGYQEVLKPCVPDGKLIWEKRDGR